MFFTLLLTGVIGFQPGTTPTAQPAAPKQPAVTLRPTRPNLQLRQQGLQVIQVVRGSTAWRQGLEPGDIIITVNREPVRSLADLQFASSRAGRVAQLQVIDCNTGYPNLVNVYPVGGRIGVACQPIPLGPVDPWEPPVPYTPGRPLGTTQAE